MLMALEALTLSPWAALRARAALVRGLESELCPKRRSTNGAIAVTSPLRRSATGSSSRTSNPASERDCSPLPLALNRRFAEAGHEIVFFYANMSHRHVPGQPAIARIELPCWATGPDTVNTVHAGGALYSQCQLASYPYSCCAHTNWRSFSDPLTSAGSTWSGAAELLREGIWAMPSAKARAKDPLRRK